MKKDLEILNIMKKQLEVEKVLIRAIAIKYAWDLCRGIRYKEVNKESPNWIFNCNALLYEIIVWKGEFIKKQKLKNPNITKDELIKEIKKAKCRKFKDKALQLIEDRMEEK